MPDYLIRSIWIRILSCFAVVILTCGLKNYLVVIVSGTALCPYLCSSIFKVHVNFAILDNLFLAQNWILEKSQSIIDLFLIDNWKLATSLVFAPVFEELIYRGPSFLTRGLIHNSLWWLIGISLSFIFALSHGRTGLALIPLFILGICSLWLIFRTHRFWPGIMLHILHNFFFTSILVYQSLWVSD